MSGVVVPVAVPVAVPVPVPVSVMPVVPVMPPEAARGIDPQEWALVQRMHQRADARADAKDPHVLGRRVASPAGPPKPRLRVGSPASQQPRPRHSTTSDPVPSKADPASCTTSPVTTPDSPDTQIFEFLKTNCKTEEYVDKIVPKIVLNPRRLKDVPELSRTLTRAPDGVPREKDILEDLGHKSVAADDEDDDDDREVARKPAVVNLPVNLLKACPLRYIDEARCVAPPPHSRRRLSSLSALSALSQRLPLPRHLRQLTVKNLKMSLGRLCRRRSVAITESDPTYKVAYLGNVLTGWAKGEGCAEKPLSTLWKNYTASNKPDVNMKVAVTRSGLKATTREHGLTEYWSHRITHCAAPPAFPRVFCWVYRHEGRKLKQELRCHAVLCAREDQARRMAQQLTERLALALLEFRRDKQSREQARLSLANALNDNPTLPQRKLMLSTGASNYRPPLERSKSAPKLGSIEESVEEEEGQVFGNPRTVARFLRDERLASVRRQRFRESLRRKISRAKLTEEPEELEPEELMRNDPRRETLTVVRVNSIEVEPDPPEDCDERLRVVESLPHPALQTGKRFLLESDVAEDAEDAAESDEGSSSLQSISSDGSQAGSPSSQAGSVGTHSHSRTDSGEDFCLGADALKTNARMARMARARSRGESQCATQDGLCSDMQSWCADRPGQDDLDDNVSDESGYVEAAPESLLARRTKDAHDVHGVHSLARVCVPACVRPGPGQCLQV